MMPRLSERVVTGAWAGYVDSTPDGVPGIGEVDELPGLILAAGFAAWLRHRAWGGPSDRRYRQRPHRSSTPNPIISNRFRDSAWGKVAEF
jgi:hypothetical protein